MTEEERLKMINEKAVMHLQDCLEQLVNEEVNGDDLLASLYGRMIAAYVLGYNPEVMLADAKSVSERLLAETEEDESEAKCPNTDENGNCPLHNLHCQYPDCLKKG